MLRVGKDKVTLESIMNGKGSFSERDLINGLLVSKVSYSNWKHTTAATQEAKDISVLLVSWKDNENTVIEVSGGIDKVIETLNVLNGTTD